eukprot:XP_001696910.1 predicted protein [Chlamydomonas reinhardtii]
MPAPVINRCDRCRDEQHCSRHCIHPPLSSPASSQPPTPSCQAVHTYMRTCSAGTIVLTTYAHSPAAAARHAHIHAGQRKRDPLESSTTVLLLMALRMATTPHVPLRT